MFRKLRLKLTLINVSVVALIFLFTVAGIYVLMMQSVNRQSEQIMQLFSSDVGPRPDSGHTDEPKKPRHWFNNFYVKTDSSENIIETSPNLPISHEALAILVQKAFATPNKRGVLKLTSHGGSYRFLKSNRGLNQESTLVFMNTENEQEILGELMGALTITGLVGLTLVFFGSLFLANRALIPIKVSWEKQKNFVADASHELRTPLAVIQTNLEVVLGNSEETVASQIKWLDNIQAENKRMAKLVDCLLFLARTDSNQEILEMKYFPLHLAIQDAVRPFEPVAAEKGIELKTTIAEKSVFYGDENRLKQLVVILLDNAIKHTPADGQVSLEMKDLNNIVEIIVTDNGEGIEKEHLEKIFERFYRVDKSRFRQNGSTGLGLSIAEWIVKGHGGTIKVTSSPGIKTTFLITLP